MSAYGLRPKPTYEAKTNAPYKVARPVGRFSAA